MQSAATDPSSLSPRQVAALAAVRAHWGEFGFPPTRAELGARLGVRAQTADFHLRALARKGLLRLGRGARDLELLGPLAGAAAETVPIVGRVAAGAPLTAIENMEGTLPVPAGSGADFALRVSGDSMIEAGILDGDLVLVEHCETAEKGEIVVALLGEGDELEATVKRYLPSRGRVVLRPANATMDDLVVHRGEAFSLAGRVVGVLRLWGRGGSPGRKK